MSVKLLSRLRVVLLLVEMVPLLVPPPVNIRVPCVRSTVPLLVKLAAMVVVPLRPRAREGAGVGEAGRAVAVAVAGGGCGEGGAEALVKAS